ncbi:hypothetical protein, partial [Bacteroides xylanisolvens]
EPFLLTMKILFASVSYHARSCGFEVFIDLSTIRNTQSSRRIIHSFPKIGLCIFCTDLGQAIIIYKYRIGID